MHCVGSALTVSSVIFLRLRRHENASCTKWREPFCHSKLPSPAELLDASPGKPPLHTSSSGCLGRYTVPVAVAVADASAKGADEPGCAGGVGAELAPLPLRAQRRPL